MQTFDFSVEAELFPPRIRRRPGHRFNYQRFDSAAEAIRFAIEELPLDVLSGSIIEAAEERLGSKEIRQLYESEAYPLERRRSVAPS
jgi:hypothetical protein